MIHSLFVLNEKLVQADLCLAPEQVTQLAALGESFGAAFQATGKQRFKITQLPKDERAVKLRELDTKVGTLSSEYADRAERLLSTEQQMRLRQIKIQLVGIDAFACEDVLRELKISALQLGQIKRIRNQFDGNVRSALDEEKKDQATVKANPNRYSQKIDGFTKSALKESQDVLSQDQQRIFSELKGATIAYTRRDLKMQLKRKAE